MFLVHVGRIKLHSRTRDTNYISSKQWAFNLPETIKVNHYNYWCLSFLTNVKARLSDTAWISNKNYDELTKTSLHIVQDYGLPGIFKDQKQNLVKQHAPAKQ